MHSSTPQEHQHPAQPITFVDQTYQTQHRITKIQKSMKARKFRDSLFQSVIKKHRDFENLSNTEDIISRLKSKVYNEEFSSNIPLVITFEKMKSPIVLLHCLNNDVLLTFKITTSQMGLVCAGEVFQDINEAVTFIEEIF
ncbi:ABCB8 [Acrasis kona]|uniref:ABCB8 n=1 Tax=Acrasis kona TaxID=1008807 RepID=A0AAW2ZCS3_9EUKA